MNKVKKIKKIQELYEVYGDGEIEIRAGENVEGEEGLVHGIRLIDKLNEIIKTLNLLSEAKK